MSNLSHCKASVGAIGANVFGELAANCIGEPWSNRIRRQSVSPSLLARVARGHLIDM
jgi:hypothetical protein